MFIQCCKYEVFYLEDGENLPQIHQERRWTQQEDGGRRTESRRNVVRNSEMFVAAAESQVLKLLTQSSGLKPTGEQRLSPRRAGEAAGSLWSDSNTNQGFGTKVDCFPGLEHFLGSFLI